MRYYSTLVFFAGLLVLMLWLVNRGRKGIKPFLRVPDGVKGLDEAVGRATEMGRPVFCHPGLSGGGAPATTAALAIINYIVRKCATQGTNLYIGVCKATTLPYVQETVHTACIAAGVPAAEKNIRVEYLSDGQFSFVAAYNGRMLREKAAANCFFGGMGADVLMYAETGARVGAFQVSGIQDTGNIHWPAIVCDYYMLPEELFEAGAILSGDVIEQNIMVAYDVMRLVCIIVFLGVGLVLTQAFGFVDWSKFISQ